jgi:ABC-type polysaccharide/polyol phosphate export permease
VSYLVQADVRKRGADTLLGNIWWILDPLLQMAVYAVFVTIIVSKQLENYPLFIFAAILPWKWFTSTMTDATSSIVGNSDQARSSSKIVPPTAASVAGIVSFVRDDRTIPAHAPLPAPDHAAISCSSPSPPSSSCSPWLRLPDGGRQRLLRDLGNVQTHVLRLIWFLSPGP